MPEPAIEVRGLRKSYGDLEAVRGIDLHVDVGEVFALLGPNGAGKTTVVEILEGHRRRSAGDVSVLEHDPAKAEPRLKERIGIVLQSTGIERFLTVAEVLELYRGYYPHPRPVDEVLELVGLKEQRDSLVRRLSGGQQRRLDVAIGLAGNPDLLFLDEPTTGFDPSARRGAWQMVKSLQELGKTVFLTTHYMDEAQHLADRVAIIVRGVIVAEGTPSELADRAGQGMQISFRLPAVAPSLPPLAADTEVANGRAVIRTDSPVPTLHELTGWALRESVELQDLTVTQPSLDDVYLALTAEH